MNKYIYTLFSFALLVQTVANANYEEFNNAKNRPIPHHIRQEITQN